MNARLNFKHRYCENGGKGRMRTYFECSLFQSGNDDDDDDCLYAEHCNHVLI